MSLLGNIAAKFTASKAGELIKNVSEVVDTFVDTKGEKAERDLKIRELIQNYNLELIKEANESDKMYLEDIQNARDNNTKIQESDKASWLAKNFSYLMDAFFILVFGIMLFVIIKVGVPETNKELFYTAFGLLGGYVGTTVNFHRGSSIGSKQNGDFLRKQLNK